MTPSTITWRGHLRLYVYGGLQIHPMLAGQYAFLLVGGWFGVQLFLCNCALVRYFVPECFEASREVVVTYGAGRCMEESAHRVRRTNLLQDGQSLVNVPSLPNLFSLNRLFLSQTFLYTNYCYEAKP